MKNALAALESADDDASRLAALLAIWRAGRSPRVADAIERLGRGDRDAVAWQRVGKQNGSKARASVGRLAKKVSDPRLATLYTTWLAQGNWPAPTAKELWTRIFDHLIALRDTRAVEPLRAVAKALPPFVGTAHRAWMTESIENAAKKLAVIKPERESAALARCLAALETKLPATTKPAPRRDAAIESVWASPDDEELRTVVADALLERDDPRGDFIAIQLRLAAGKAMKSDRARAAALEKKHGTEWLGAIGKLTTRGSWRFENGFPVIVALDRRLVPRREWEAAAVAPEWATIHTLRISLLITPKWWVTAWVKSPATRNVLAFELGDIASKRPGFRIEREPGGPWRLSDLVRGYWGVSASFIAAFLAGLAPAERARFTIAKGVAAPELAAILAG